ncbi:BadF/BadG/BcrA/BcrD ATPase family protein [Devosia equisanguinis]|uniref:BadF/BadG/BcrA/BcrD ATPase family protein n=1 Tax=Devosia equisanguinis TaxID=2490941 RepID=A0A3S4CFB7_9HYPH|nr:BadF/BadG/BcrA/BcrD ATPase family protein [Devosia equisanguinis]VDS06752.1 BadF/BadG/BcrA/BcrD ATPase family protein [Devosia equisanguinis]
MSNPVWLGLDVGGTASRWVACGADGAVVARGRVAGATGHVFNPAEREKLRLALEAIAGAVAAAGLTPTHLAAGLTGYGAAVATDVAGLVAERFGIGAESVLLADDMTLAFAAIFAPGEGHLISAGTGSIGLHLGEDGALVRVGGRGILIDDAGSGSWIALRALDKIYRCLDHTGSFADVQRLADAMFALVGGTDWSDVRQLVYGGDRGRIGALAVGVGKAAEVGDALALEILTEAGRELAALARALTARAGTKPIGFVGGVLGLHRSVVEAISAQLADQVVLFPEADAALAAAQMFGPQKADWRALLAANQPG